MGEGGYGLQRVIMAKIALLQMVSSSSVAENLQIVTDLLKEAQDKGAKLVVLPENFAFMGLKETDKVQVAEVEGAGPIQEKISQLAKNLGLWIVAGTMPIKTTGTKVRSSCLVYDDKGSKVARYDKIHLFDMRVSEKEAHKESSTIDPGKELVVVDTPIGKIGLTVCYDLRFPELYYQLLAKGAQIFTVPSAFTEVTGRAHWEVLLRARAIENLAYVVAANQGGQHENMRHTYGHSMIVEPWGTIVGKQTTGNGVLTADIDLQHLQQVRTQFPSVDHHVLTKSTERTTA